MARKNSPQISFDAQLVLFKYFLHELKLDSLESLSEQFNRAEYEGFNESGNTYFYEQLANVCRMQNANVSQEKLRLYDEKINFAKGEGSQAIQLFGRGVRLKGYGGCLKRSGKLDDLYSAK